MSLFGHNPPVLAKLESRLTEINLEFIAASVSTTDYLNHPECLAPEFRPLAAYLAQLEEEGYATKGDDRLSIDWEDLYRLLGHPDHASSLFLLQLPPLSEFRPALVSKGALNDADFGIFLDGWRMPSGAPVRGQAERIGATLRVGNETRLLPEAGWRLLEAVRAFARLPVGEKTRDRNFREWGRIRALAKQAGTLLDRFLETTLVLTPEKLRLELRKVESGGVPVVEITPTFDDVPTWWLNVFDDYASVPDRYDHTQPGGGIAHVVVEPEVRRVLGQVKRMPKRRVAGVQAEAFLRNPYAVLGEEAATVIPPEDFEAARAAAGVEFLAFHLEPVREGGRLAKVVILIAPKDVEFAATERLTLATPTALQAFIIEFDKKSAADKLCCVWEGFELELGPDAEAKLEQARSWLIEWTKARVLITSEAVYDLSGYGPRVEGIGTAKPVYSPFITRTGEKGGWLPENVEVGIAFKPSGSDQTLLLPFAHKDQAAFERALAQVTTAGQTEFHWPGLPTPISLHEAQALKADVDLALKDVQAGAWKDGPPPQASEKPGKPKGRAPTLLIPHNIETVEYAEQRRTALVYDGGLAHLPASIKKSVHLLEHQNHGVAWLQHLWRHSPGYARGCLLADDMGLGKTLQLLVFLARAFEDTPALPPALIVAPVALLDNWQREIKHFFEPETFRVLTLYGRELAACRVSREAIDDQLLGEGLTRFLCPGWLSGAQLVLTTYETLRDYEFSLARENWSVMICDEAQKIKSPAALVTHAAKSMNARFKIAATGTPVENSLTDLWCLFDFIQPGLLGALNEFGRKYKRPIEAKTDKERAALDELQALYAPQLLRRTKAEVIKDLPPKTEDPNCRELPISNEQRHLYAEALVAHRAKITASDSKRVGQAMLGMLFYLRTLCAHPVPMGQVADISRPLHQAFLASPKLAWLMTALEDIKSREEKVIIFTELRDIQRVLQHYIGEHFGNRPVIVNGDTDARSDRGASRQNLIDAFQNRQGFGVIILSTQAVGFGLNIQAANHVIHYSRPWNPAKEDQATDRAYRIGQAKPVTVYYPTVHARDFDTFERRLDELLTIKRELAAKTWLNGADDIRVDQFGNLAAGANEQTFPSRPVGEEDLPTIEGFALEALCTLLWDKQGFHTHCTPKSGDGGVDVVAWREGAGYLIQCKASSTEDHALGWEAVRDVSAGAKAYTSQYPGVRFRRVAVTNQRFNDNARRQAVVLGVELIDREKLLSLLGCYPIQIQEFRLSVA